MKVVQKDDTVSSMEDSQQLLGSEDEKQAQTDVEISRKIRLKKHTTRKKKKSTIVTGY